MHLRLLLPPPPVVPPAIWAAEELRLLASGRAVGPCPSSKTGCGGSRLSGPSSSLWLGARPRV